MAKFAVNDAVKVTDKNHAKYDTSGKVTAVTPGDPDGTSYTVQPDHASHPPFPANEGQLAAK